MRSKQLEVISSAVISPTGSSSMLCAFASSRSAKRSRPLSPSCSRPSRKSHGQMHAGMRDWLAHHYFDTSRAIIEATITEDLPRLEAAVRRLQLRTEKDTLCCSCQPCGTAGVLRDGCSKEGRLGRYLLLSLGGACRRRGMGRADLGSSGCRRRCWIHRGGAVRRPPSLVGADAGPPAPTLRRATW